ncbi:sensor histidine kinase [Clavibacter michiganensis]|uniref:sensor histidine kinase n=1 Tax=Clavibacter michiganensis TaxID=28447 RepID=UPI00068D2779|nr:histidine kinase [Clavibacter michiganensis]
MPSTRGTGRRARPGRTRVSPAGLAGITVLAALALFDLLVSTPGWAAAYAAVAVLAVLAHRHRLRAWIPAAASLLLTATMAVAHPLGVGSFGLGELAALLVLLITIVREAAGRSRVGVAAAVALAVLALPVRVLSGDSPVYVIVLALMVVGGVAVGGSLRAGDHAARERVEVARRGEREAIARELHDVVAHHVTGMVVVAQAARAVPLDPAGAARMLAEIEGAGERALEAMQQLVGVLRTDAAGSAPVAPVATLADLPALVARFADAAPAAVEVRLPAGDDPAARAVPDEVQAGVYRIVQEGLTNVRRHAPDARNVRVAVALEGGRIHVEVRDDGGRGSDPATRAPGSGGFGIVGMEERARALGGALDAGPDGDGWIVRADLPAGRA